MGATTYQMPMVPRERWPAGYTQASVVPLEVHRDRDFLVVIYPVPGFEDHRRMTVIRAQPDLAASRAASKPIWKEGLTWDDLMFCKRACGFSDTWGVEVFPPDRDVVNVANMRHVWLLPAAPEFAWRRGSPR